MRGIEERRLAGGRIAYLARVRRQGVARSATFCTPEEAIAWRATALPDVRAGRPPQVPARPAASNTPITLPVTVEDAARSLVRGMRLGTIRTKTGTLYKPSVVRKYEEALRCQVLPRIGALPVAAVTRGDVQRLVDEIAAQATVEHARKALVALRVALRHVDLPDACQGVRAPVSSEPGRPARILTPEDVDAVLVAAEGDDERLKRSFAAPLLALLAGTGLRLGEALGAALGPGGPRPRGGRGARAPLGRSRPRRRRELLFVPPKTRSSRRDVPLGPTDAARIRRHLLACGRPAEGALVFADERGGPLTPERPRKAFRRAVKAAGIAEPRPKLHDLRHAYASALLAAGLSMHAIADLLGHAGPALVMARYGHAYRDEVAGAAVALERFREARLPRVLPLAAAGSKKGLQTAT